jgi:hypothetical protein
VAELVVGQQGRSAVGVVNDRYLKPRALGSLGLDQVGGVSDVPDHGRGHPAADVALHESIAELDPEDLRRVDPAVDADDDVEALPRQERERGHVLPGVGIGEHAVAVKEVADVGHGLSFAFWFG